MNLDFLKDVKIEAVQKSAPKKKAAAPKLPEEADIRLFKNGRVYPSKAFAEKHGLEFSARTAVAVEGKDDKLVPSGNGLDIFASGEWAMIGELPQALLFCAVVAKALPKVDMWGSTKYEEDGSPKASVFTQGANTFAKTRLTAMVADAYGINWDQIEYVDLTLVEDSPMVSPNGIYIVPKIISTGPKKGQPDYIRRENLNVCPLVVHSTFPSEVTEAAPALDAAEDTAEAQAPVDTATAPEATAEDPGEDWADQLGKPEPAQAAQ